MKFFEAFEIKRGDIICIVGAGGKTSLMMHLAKELTEEGLKVLLTTTTRLASSEVNAEFDFFADSDGTKAKAPCISKIYERSKNYDITLIEADGSAGKPLKGWRSDEPVIPEFANMTIGVVDISVIDKKPEIHRREIFRELTGYADSVTLKTLVSVINNPEGIFRNSDDTKNIIFFNKAESNTDIRNANRLAKLLNCISLYGSIIDNYIKKTTKLSSVIMAAGSSSRMGENKLLLKIKNSSMISQLVTVLPFDILHKNILIYSDERVAAETERPEITMIKSEPGAEKHVTVRLGTNACRDSDGIIFFVADQPFLKQKTIIRLAEAFYENRTKIIIPTCNGKNRNPVIFPEKVYSELMEITGDRGGRDVIEGNPDLCIYVEFEDEDEFIDIDTRQDYERYSR